MQAGQSVLDVGCGIGGSAFFMAAEYDVQVRGVDLSTNMITLALENQAKLDEPTKKKVIKMSPYYYFTDIIPSFSIYRIRLLFILKYRFA